MYMLMRGEVAGREAGGREAVAAQAAVCSGKARLEAVGGQGTRGAHFEHGNHVRDLGGVKAQRLVEDVRALPSRREKHAMRGRCGPGGGRAWGGGASGMHGKARLKAVGGQGTRGAHREHGEHVCDLGGVKAQRLIERRRDLPSRREGHAMRGEVRAGRREGVGRSRRKRHAREGPTQGCWGPGHARSARRTCSSCP